METRRKRNGKRGKEARGIRRSCNRRNRGIRMNKKILEKKVKRKGITRRGIRMEGGGGQKSKIRRISERMRERIPTKIVQNIIRRIIKFLTFLCDLNTLHLNTLVWPSLAI